MLRLQQHKFWTTQWIFTIQTFLESLRIGTGGNFLCFHQSFFNKYNLLLFIIIIIFSDTAAQRGLLPPRSRGFLITHNDTPQSVGLLWTSDQLVAETST
jgi:hypothetical protein